MIFEAAIAGGTISFIASLRFAWWAVKTQHEREDELLKEPPALMTPNEKAFQEKKRILERQRNGFAGSLKNSTAEQYDWALKEIVAVDERLMALADEQKKGG